MECFATGAKTSSTALEMTNYFNALPSRRQLAQLGRCRLMAETEFRDGVKKLEKKKIVIIGCGAQGLHQGLCLKDSGLDVAYALRKEAIAEKRQSWKNATENGFSADTCEKLVPEADLVLNLTPDKQHAQVLKQAVPLMKKKACLSYSHGFNIVEQGQRIRDDLTVIMVAPKCPGTEVRQEYLRGFGVPSLVAVHEENDPRGEGLDIARAYAAGIGSHRAGVLESSFVAEVKSDLMGEQVILCGLQQAASLLCFNRMQENGVDPAFAAGLVQRGWETITEALKHGGISHMMDRLSNPAKIRAFHLAEELKSIMQPLFEKHMDDVMSGAFSAEMMQDWENGDTRLLAWRKEIAETPFEQVPAELPEISEQDYFDKAPLMLAFIRAGAEMAFEIMTATGMKPASAYYESLHEVPLIANLIARRRLHEMNLIISDTAEYGSHLFTEACMPLLADFMKDLDTDVIGKGQSSGSTQVDNSELIAVNRALREHPAEIIGHELRSRMTAMKQLN